MRRTKTRLLPSVDVTEPRLLLSTGAHILSGHALSGVVREVRAIVSTLAKTDNTAQASEQLAGLASQFPSGSEGLTSSWQSDIALYRPHSARSTITTEQRLIATLDRIIRNAGNGGSGPVPGSGSTNPGEGTGGTTTPTPGQGATGTPTPGQRTPGTPTPVPTSTLDSVRIQNTTGLAIVVTVHLEVPQIQQPYITETIPAQGDPVAFFNFGTATNAFMTIDVSTANGAQSPPPFDNIDLSQPVSGYNGITFTISLFGPYFSVNVP